MELNGFYRIDGAYANAVQVLPVFRFIYIRYVLKIDSPAGISPLLI